MEPLFGNVFEIFYWFHPLMTAVWRKENSKVREIDRRRYSCIRLIIIYLHLLSSHASLAPFYDFVNLILIDILRVSLVTKTFSSIKLVFNPVICYCYSRKWNASCRFHCCNRNLIDRYCLDWFLNHDCTRSLCECKG